MIRFRKSTSVGVALQSPQIGAYYVCQVDDQEEVRLNHQTGTLTIATGLSLEEHVAKCGRSGEASYGKTSVTGVVIDDAGDLLTVEEPLASALRYEAIGDSITAGFKVTVPAGSGAVPATPENEDVFKTYVRHLADAWGILDYHVVAKSGISILPYGNGLEKVMAQEWPCRSFWAAWQGGCPVLWDFTSWQADIVTINLGTNDFAFGNPTREAFKKGYSDLIQSVRRNYPGALIICIQPLQYSCGGGSAKLQAIIDGLEDAVAEAQSVGDRRVRYHTTGTISEPWLDCRNDYVDYTHPTVEGNKKFADKLLETLTADVREFFPGQCGGTGSTCQQSSFTLATASPAPDQLTPLLTPLPTTQPTLDNGSVDSRCAAVPQSRLPAGSWATTDEECSKCVPGYSGYPAGYPWWPCDTSPALCKCNDTSMQAPASATVPVAATGPSGNTPAPTLGSQHSSCQAVLQSSLPLGFWATTTEQCEKCAPEYAGHPGGYPWWPCDAKPQLCWCS
jgi:lysophospholipase L1-like esterase